MLNKKDLERIMLINKMKQEGSIVEKANFDEIFINNVQSPKLEN